MISRRNLLKLLSTLPLGGLAGGLFGNGTAAQRITRRSYRRDYFKELGIRTFINAQGTYTYLTGSLMHPAVLDAINYTADHYCDFNELQEKAGEERIVARRLREVLEEARA